MSNFNLSSYQSNDIGTKALLIDNGVYTYAIIQLNSYECHWLDVVPL